MRVIRASEIGAYLYCRRAWWYGRQGVPNENQAELAAGRQVHSAHGRTVTAAGCQRALAYLLLLGALILITAYLTSAALS